MCRAQALCSRSRMGRPLCDAHQNFAAVGPVGAFWLCAALGGIARARGMTDIAKAAGITREALYKALRPGSAPRFDTVNRVCAALGVRRRPQCPDNARSIPTSNGPAATAQRAGSSNVGRSASLWCAASNASRSRRDLELAGALGLVLHHHGQKRSLVNGRSREVHGAWPTARRGCALARCRCIF